MDTIVPVMGQTETALLAISTALDEGNHYSALTKLEDKETGEPLFNVIRVGQVCEACQKTSTPWVSLLYSVHQRSRTHYTDPIPTVVQSRKVCLFV